MVHVECVPEEVGVALDDGDHHGEVIYVRISMEIHIDSCTA